MRISVYIRLSKFLGLIMCLVYQNTLEAAENLIKAHEAFITTTDANDEKINAVLQFANRLIEDQHYAADKVHKKAENISERYVKSPCWLVLCLSLFDVKKTFRDPNLLHNCLADGMWTDRERMNNLSV